MAVGEQNQKSVRRISTISDMRAVSRELSPFGKRKTRLQNQQFSDVTLKIYKTNITFLIQTNTRYTITPRSIYYSHNFQKKPELF